MSVEIRWFLYQVFLRPNIMVTVYHFDPEEAVDEAIDHLNDYIDNGSVIEDVVTKDSVDFKPKVLAVCEVHSDDINYGEPND